MYNLESIHAFVNVYSCIYNTNISEQIRMLFIQTYIYIYIYMYRVRTGYLSTADANTGPCLLTLIAWAKGTGSPIVTQPIRA